MLEGWLGWVERTPCTYEQFSVIDIEEEAACSSEVKARLKELIVSSRQDPGFLSTMADYLDWQDVEELIVAATTPTLERVKRGDFGEALAATMLEEFHGYTIPVPKLRFKLAGNQTLPSTDTLALRFDDAGLVSEACFVESKLRTVRDIRAAVDGYEQLVSDYENKLPGILMFVAHRLWEQRHPLFDSFAKYMADRVHGTERDTFRLGLCYDTCKWDEAALLNLEDRGVELPALRAHVTRIRDLRVLTDGLFSELGMTGEFEDE